MSLSLTDAQELVATQSEQLNPDVNQSAEGNHSADVNHLAQDPISGSSEETNDIPQVTWHLGGTEIEYLDKPSDDVDDIPQIRFHVGKTEIEFLDIPQLDLDSPKLKLNRPQLDRPQTRDEEPKSAGKHEKAEKKEREETEELNDTKELNDIKEGAEKQLKSDEATAIESGTLPHYEPTIPKRTYIRRARVNFDDVDAVPLILEKQGGDFTLTFSNTAINLTDSKITALKAEVTALKTELAKTSAKLQELQELQKLQDLMKKDSPKLESNHGIGFTPQYAARSFESSDALRVAAIIQQYLRT